MSVTDAIAALAQALALAVVVIAVVGGLHGALARIVHEMRSLWTIGPLSDEGARVLQGTCIFVGAAVTLVGYAVMSACWSGNAMLRGLGVAVFGICIVVDLWLCMKYRGRMRRS